MADLLAFPADRLAGRARHVAAMLDKRTGRARDTYYAVICNNLAKQLFKAGFPPAEVQRQIGRFDEAVQRCIAEGWHFEDPQPPGHQSDLFDRQPEGAA